MVEQDRLMRDITHTGEIVQSANSVDPTTSFVKYFSALTVLVYRCSSRVYFSPTISSRVSLLCSSVSYIPFSFY